MALERLDPGADIWRLYAADHLARYLAAEPLARGRRVLDAGTGHGYGAAVLAAGGAAEVVAVDICPATLQAAAARFPLANLRFVLDDCTRLDKCDGPFDLICSFENIEHLSDPGGFVAAAADRLTADGVLVCSTPDRASTPAFVDGRPANPYHTHEWYADEFRELLVTRFAEVDLRCQVRRFVVDERQARADALYMTWRLGPRAVRALLHRLRGWPPPPPVREESVGVPDDYPIVPRPTAGLFGTTICHYAVCRRPKPPG
jgi:SAM-dependent methyltransferase